MISLREMTLIYFWTLQQLGCRLFWETRAMLWQDFLRTSETSAKLFHSEFRKPFGASAWFLEENP